LLFLLLLAFSHLGFSQLPQEDRSAANVAGRRPLVRRFFIIFHRFFSVSMVTRAMLAEAFVCYLIIAIAFSQLYLLLSRVVDHQFNEQITQSSTFLYFSMDTLSGVGTGVIAPINPYIRLITGIENMIGIFYLAVVVSRLVSSYRPRNRQQRHQPADQPIE
jgi:hypothetical protein